MMRCIGTVLLFGVLAAVALPQEAPSDAALDLAIARFTKERKQTLDGVPDPAVEAALGDMAVEKLSTAQIDRLAAIYMPQTGTAATKERFAKRLDQLAADRGADGAIAAARLVEFMEYRPKKAGGEGDDAARRKRLDAIVRAAKHPGFAAAIAAGRDFSLYLQVYFAGETDALAEAGVFEIMAREVKPEWPAKEVRQLIAFYDAVSSARAKLEPAKKEALRKIAVQVIERALAGDLPDYEKKYLTHERNQLTAAFATGTLIGHPAPKMDFIWSSAGDPPKSLADFRGKIVVIDFFATWCVPCVKAFPHVKELAARYEKDGVVFLGVTSLQGFMVYPRAKANEKKVTNLTREQEIGRMGGWVKDMDVTWTVVLTEQDAFNPDFGIKSIPHFAVIDRAGTVVETNVEAEDDSLVRILDRLIAEKSAPGAH